MRLTIYVCGFLLCVGATTASGSFVSGNQLQQRLAAYDREQANSADSDDLFPAALALGYVTGVVDTTSGIVVCASPKLTANQAMAIVSRRLRAHPEEWDRPAYSIVISALSDAFPCKPK